MRFREFIMNWLMKWLKQLLGQAFYMSAPLCIIVPVGVLLSYIIPAYTVPLTFLLAIVVYSLFARYSKWY